MIFTDELRDKAKDLARRARQVHKEELRKRFSEERYNQIWPNDDPKPGFMHICLNCGSINISNWDVSERGAYSGHYIECSECKARD